MRVHCETRRRQKGTTSETRGTASVEHRLDPLSQSNGLPVWVWLDRDVVVSVPSPELIRRRPRHLEALDGAAVDLDLQVEVGDRAVERVVLGPDGIGVDPGDEVLG